MQTLVFSWMLMLSALTGAVSNFPVDMFETTSHNFGTVVRGSKTEFDFVFTNKYAEDVVIESVTSSCQCTTPSFGPRGAIRTGERGRVHISINTQNFTGNKNATITVRFARPYRVEMQLHSYVFIRSDVSVSPGIVYFGSVDPEKTTPVVPVNLNSINSGWRIVDVTSNCQFLSVKLLQPNPQYPNYYSMNVMVKKNAPPGPFSEILEVVTNDYDQRSRIIPIRVEGRIKQTLSASPSPLAFNIVEQGSAVEKTLVVQGAEPFQIVDITSENQNISASIDNVRKKIQPIKLIYSGVEPGEFRGKVTVITDLEGGMETAVNFSGRVVARKTEAIPLPKEEPESEPASEPTSEPASQSATRPTTQPTTKSAPSDAPLDGDSTKRLDETVPEIESSLNDEQIPEMPVDQPATKEAPATEIPEEVAVPDLPAAKNSAKKNAEQLAPADEEPALDLDAVLGDEIDGDVGSENGSENADENRDAVPDAKQDAPAAGKNVDDANEEPIELLELPSMNEQENATENSVDGADEVPDALDSLDDAADKLPEGFGEGEDADVKTSQKQEKTATPSAENTPDLNNSPETSDEELKDANEAQEANESPLLNDDASVETPVETPIENRNANKKRLDEESQQEDALKDGDADEIQAEELEDLLPEDVSEVSLKAATNSLSVSAKEPPVLIGRNLLKSKN